MKREPHIWTPAQDSGRGRCTTPPGQACFCSGKCREPARPFTDYTPQPDTAERTRLAVQSIPFALPEKVDAALGPSSPEADELFNNILEGMARALPEKKHE